jgi:Fe-S oxidoreductase
VLLWPDTFNNHFHPATAHAAVEVLEAAGYEVAIPPKRLCCGRPLYEFGMLDRARRYLRDILATLEEDIAKATPIVVLEPACASTFRDELVDLLFRDEQARRLSKQVVLLEELLVREADWKPPPLERRAIVHGHCHQQAILGMDAQREALERAGVRCDIPDAGCCGMAGSFGFEKEKYDVSMACAERVLLPALRAADDSTLVIANGFSCREQVEQATGERPLHLAQVLAMALRDRSSSARAPSGTHPGTAA